MKTIKNVRPEAKEMAIGKRRAIIPRSFLVFAAITILLFIAVTPGFGQKEGMEVKRATSLEGLAETGFMTTAEVSDDLEGTEDEYFYKFKGRQGKLTLTLEVTANQTNAGATFDLLGPNSKPILSNILVQAANGGTNRTTKSVNLAKAQDLVIHIKGLRYGSSSGYPGVYKIRLEGPAINFDDAAVEPSGSGTIPTPNPAAPQIPDASPPSVTNQVPEPTLPSPAETSVPTPANPTDPQDPPAAAARSSDAGKKPGKVDRAIDTAKKKSEKFLQVLEKVKTIKP